MFKQLNTFYLLLPVPILFICLYLFLLISNNYYNNYNNGYNYNNNYNNYNNGHSYNIYNNNNGQLKNNNSLKNTTTNTSSSSFTLKGNNNNVNNNVNNKKEETFTTQPLLPIFLLVTSDETDFKPLQQCAVESACLHGGKFTELKIYNKNFNINKILTKFKTLNICQFKNLTFLPLNYEQIHRGLITEEWYRNKQWEIGFTSNNLSNAARLALLYKYGGVYIDTDYLILRDVTTLRNALAYEMNGTLNSMINNAFMVFNEKNNKFIEFALSTFVRGFNGKHWGYNGPHVFLRVKYSYSYQNTICFEINR